MKVKTLAELLAIPDSTLTDGDTVHVAYRSTRTDGGGGTFLVVPTANNPFNIDNLGCIVSSASAAYVFIRQQFLDDGRLNPRWFGAPGDGSDQTTALNNWLNTYDALDTQGTSFETGGFQPWLQVPAGKYYWGTKRAWYPKNNNPIMRGVGYKSHLVNLTIGLCNIYSTASLRFAQITDLTLDGNNSNDIGIALGHPYKWANGLQINTSTTRSCTTTANSPNVTLTSGNTTGLTAGMSVTSDKIPAGSVIQSITNSTQFVLTSGAGITAGTGITATFIYTLSCTTTADSPNVTITVGDKTTLKVGMAVTSANIPFGSTILSITDSTHFVLAPPDNLASGIGVTTGTSVSTIFGGNNWGGPQECRISRIRIINHTLAGIINTRDNMSRLEEVHAEDNAYNLLMISGVDTEFNGCHFRDADLDNIRIQPWQGNETTGALLDLAGGYSMTDCSARGANRYNFFATGGTRNTYVEKLTDAALAGYSDIDWFTSHPQMPSSTRIYIGDLWECYFWNCSWANISTKSSKWKPRTLTVSHIEQSGSNISVTCTTPHYFTKNLLFENGMIQFEGTGTGAYDDVALTPSGGRKITDVKDQYTFDINIGYSSEFTGSATLKVPNYEFKIIGQEKAWTPKSIKDLWFSGKNTNFCYFERCQDIYVKGCRFKNQVVLGENVLGFHSDHKLGITPDVTDENLYVPYVGPGALGGHIREGLTEFSVVSGTTKTPNNYGWGVERAYTSSALNMDGSASVYNAIQARSTYAFIGAWTRPTDAGPFGTPLTDTVTGIVARGSGNVEYNVAGSVKLTMRASDGIFTFGNTATNPGASSALTVNALALNGSLAPINAAGYRVPAAILNRMDSTGTLVSCRYDGVEVGSIIVSSTTTAYKGKNTNFAQCSCTYTGTSLNSLASDANAWGVSAIAQDGSIAGKVTITLSPGLINTNPVVNVTPILTSADDPSANLLIVSSRSATTIVVEGRNASNATKHVPFMFTVAGQ